MIIKFWICAHSKKKKTWITSIQEGIHPHFFSKTRMESPSQTKKERIRLRWVSGAKNQRSIMKWPRKITKSISKHLNKSFWARPEERISTRRNHKICWNRHLSWNKSNCWNEPRWVVLSTWRIPTSSIKLWSIWTTWIIRMETFCLKMLTNTESTILGAQ